MSVRQKAFTAQDLLQTPADGLRRELVRGEVRTMAPAGFSHGRMAMNVAVTFGQHVRARGLGGVVAAETGFKISSNPDTVRAPDVAFVASERIGEAGDVPGYWPGAPDLAVEVVSPNDRFSEVEEKVQDWLSAGTSMVLVVDPQGRTVTVRLPGNRVAILTEKEVIEGGEAVPDWSLPVADVFR